MKAFFFNKICGSFFDFSGGKPFIRNKHRGRANSRADIGKISVINAVKFIHMRPCPVFAFAPHGGIFRRFQAFDKGIHLIGFEVIKTSAHGHIENKAFRNAEFESRADKLYCIPCFYIFTKSFAYGKFGCVFGIISSVADIGAGFCRFCGFRANGFQFKKPCTGKICGDDSLCHLGLGTCTGSDRIFDPHSENRKSCSSGLIKILYAKNTAGGIMFFNKKSHQLFKGKGS